MKDVITLNNKMNNKNKQEAGSSIANKIESSEIYSKAAGEPAIQVRQNKPGAQPYSENEHATLALDHWSNSTHAVQLAEEDMNDPDLAVSFSGNRGYTLQPG